MASLAYQIQPVEESNGHFYVVLAMLREHPQICFSSHIYPYLTHQ
jgi:hypothetical protein